MCSASRGFIVGLMLKDLTTLVQKALADEFGIADAAVRWERPQDAAHGDKATPAALSAAKQAGKAPRVIAEVLAKALQASPHLERTEVAGPGYVNIWLKSAALLRTVEAAQQSCAPLPVRKEAPVIIDYSSPNIAKPLGIHHILSTVIGQALTNLHQHAGYPVLRWNYLGDWGTQFGALAVAIQHWSDGRAVSEYSLDELLDLYVKFHSELEKNPALEEESRAAFRRLEQNETAIRAVWQDIVAVSKKSLEDLYKRLGVSFDLDIGESFFEDKMKTILNEGKQKKVFTEGERGALIVTFPEETKLPPYLVQKSDGSTLYSTRDFALMKYRIETYHPQAIYILSDVSQKLHFEQLTASFAQLQWPIPRFENVIFGRMRFSDRSMSTRRGNVLKLEHVLDEAVERAKQVIASHGDAIQTDDVGELADMMGVGAVAYGILSQNRKMDIVFDWDKALSFEGNSAPYLQYTHARARSVIRKAEVNVPTPADVQGEVTSHERALMNHLAEFPMVLEEARTTLLPHVLANYLYELAQTFNAFYNTEPILKADANKRGLRLNLTAVTATILKTGAELLTLRVPEKM